MEIALIVLASVIIAQGVERYFYSKDMMEKLDNAHKLNNSKTAQDYVTLKAADTIKPEKFKAPDEVSIEEATDEEFEKHIKNLNNL